MKGVVVLIAEDNEANIDMLDRRLRRRGFTTVLAINGLEAVEHARRTPPDIILMDIEMPVMSGYDALKALRADPSLAKLPVLAVTAHATPAEEKACRAAGFDGFVTKPLQFQVLLDTIHGVLGGLP